MDTVDVLIVGGGIVGLATGMALAETRRRPGPHLDEVPRLLPRAGRAGGRDHRGDGAGEAAGELRRAAVGPGRPPVRGRAGGSDRAVPWRVLRADPGRGAPLPQPHLPGPRPAAAVPGRPLHADGRRRGRVRAERRAGVPPRGLPADRRERPRPVGAGPLRRVLADGRAVLADRARRAVPIAEQAGVLAGAAAAGAGGAAG